VLQRKGSSQLALSLSSVAPDAVKEKALLRSPSDDSVLPQTRVVAAILVPVLGTAAVLLYVFPRDTKELFAWTINPAMTPIVMGAAYGAGAYFWTRVFFSSQWHRVAAVCLPTTVFTWLSGIATVLHWDRFNHDHVTFWAWAGIYFITPLLVPVTWWLNGLRFSAPGERNDVIMPQAFRYFMGAAGALVLAYALLMFVSPSTVIPHFAWKLSPLTARVLSAWFAFFGLGWISLALDARWSVWQIIMESSAIAVGLILIGVVRAWDDFDTGSIATWGFIGGMLISLAVVVSTYGYAVRQQRRQLAVGSTAR